MTAASDWDHVQACARLVWGEPAMQVWWNSANSRLDGARPVDVWRLEGFGPRACSTLSARRTGARSTPLAS